VDKGFKRLNDQTVLCFLHEDGYAIRILPSGWKDKYYVIMEDAIEETSFYKVYSAQEITDRYPELNFSQFLDIVGLQDTAVAEKKESRDWNKLLYRVNDINQELFPECGVVIERRKCTVSYPIEVVIASNVKSRIECVVTEKEEAHMEEATYMAVTQAVNRYTEVQQVFSKADTDRKLSFIAITTNYWGRGKTSKEAEENLKGVAGGSSGYKNRVLYYIIGDDTPYVDELGRICFTKGAIAIFIEAHGKSKSVSR
jgi:hypothetical protein